VERQFPAVGATALARGIVHEQWVSPVLEARASRQDRERHFRLAAEKFALAARIESVRTEALVRLAHARLMLDEPTAAVEALAGVQPSDDDDLAYLTHLFRGMALGRTNEPDAARAELSRALEIKPDAHSSTVALVTILARVGRLDEAEERRDRLLTLAAPAYDPWWSYSQADYRHWPSRIAEVRRHLLRNEE
jgi:hypothetical protein